MPAGDDVTVPLPLPALLTVSANDCSVNVAVTVFAAFIATVHVPVPVHPPPDQPANVELALGVAVRVTDVPALYGSVQSVPHVMPAGDELTVPVPVPVSATVSAKVCTVNCADADAALDPAGMLHVVEAPLHAPLQPANVEFDAGDAVSVTAAVVLNEAEHVLPQEIPAGDELTVPDPDPVSETLTVRVVGPGSVVSPPPPQAARSTTAIARQRAAGACIHPLGRSQWVAGGHDAPTC